MALCCPRDVAEFAKQRENAGLPALCRDAKDSSCLIPLAAAAAPAPAPTPLAPAPAPAAKSKMPSAVPHVPIRTHRFASAAFKLPSSSYSTCSRRAERPCREPVDNASAYESATPLAGKERWWWLLQLRGRFATRCVTPIATAVALAKGELVNRTSLPHEAMPARFKGKTASEWHYVPDVLQAVGGEPCLVYSFGVQHADEFTDFWAAMGCHVYAFDPTVDYYKAPAHSNPNVTFFRWGLISSSNDEQGPKSEERTGGDGGDEVTSLTKYGAILGDLLSFGQIVARLGHQGKTLAAVKLDCEGCEWETLRALWCDASGQLPQILTLNVEFHLQVARRMRTWADVERIRYARLYLEEHGFRSFQFHHHPAFRGAIEGYRGGAQFMHPDLDLALRAVDGNQWTVCCYNFGLINEPLLQQWQRRRP